MYLILIQYNICATIFAEIILCDFSSFLPAVAKVQFDQATYEVTEGDAVVSISVDCGACFHNYTIGVTCSDGTATCEYWVHSTC